VDRGPDDVGYDSLGGNKGKKHKKLVLVGKELRSAEYYKGLGAVQAG